MLRTCVRNNNNNNTVGEKWRPRYDICNKGSLPPGIRDTERGLGAAVM